MKHVLFSVNPKQPLHENRNLNMGSNGKGCLKPGRHLCRKHTLFALKPCVTKLSLCANKAFLIHVQSRPEVSLSSAGCRGLPVICHLSPPVLHVPPAIRCHVPSLTGLHTTVRSVFILETLHFASVMMHDS
jgi:hypothetical protein